MRIKYNTRLGRIINKIYQLVNPIGAGNARVAELERLHETGKLASMCSSQVHRYFGITREA